MKQTNNMVAVVLVNHFLNGYLDLVIKTTGDELNHHLETYIQDLIDYLFIMQNWYDS